jgi:uncharacterized protein (DUF433 family)
MIKITKQAMIQSSRAILGGEPVFRGTRVPVRALIDYLKAGDRVDDFLKDFPSVKKNQVMGVLELAKKDFARG